MAVQIPAVERARALVRSAVASGTLTRPPACERCAACCPLDAHHADYARPLQVTWLCLSCHLLAHPRPPRPARPGSARARAERELRSDPARSDALIAAAAHCSAQAAGRWRHALERAGVIEAIEPSQRLAIPRAWPPRTPARIAIERHGASTPEQVMRLSGVSYGTTWRALARARQRAPLENRFSGVADAAAATDQLTVIRSQPGFRGTSPETRLRAGSIELPCCTAEYTPAGWVHERSCALRLAAR